MLALGVGFGPQEVWATHIRAGDIQAKVDTTVGAGFNPRRVFFKMVLYTDNGSQVKQPAATIFYGDGTSSTLRRGAARGRRAAHSGQPRHQHQRLPV
ncbi:hypothetical protein ACFQT0_21740 [Hymenobacter humi]|uniref:Uncharacterized protein n=1 Tax=Hymenobacter humi TaxID=1411620 RepID=A0ABW2U884_9BACT